MDRHEIWRRVEYDYGELKRRTPEGLEPVVEVFLAGRELPVELGWVETHRGADDAWVRFESAMRASEEGDDTTLPAEGCWVHVHESCILRVEVRFRRPDAGPATGFRYTVADDD